MRDELAAAYKAQSQATQRLIAVNDTLRAQEEQARVDSDNMRKLQDELTILRRKVAQHNEILSEKDKTVQVSRRHRFLRRAAMSPLNPVAEPQ